MSNEVIVFDAADVEKNKVIAILMALFPILFFLPLVSDEMKASAYLKHTANSALIIFIGSIISGALAAVIIGFFVAIAVLVYQIILLINVIQANGKSLPLLDKVQIIK